MRSMTRRVIIAMALLGVVAGVSPGQGSGIQAGPPGDSPLEARTREVAAQLRCPVCQGNSIQDSPSELALEMKGVVREQLQSGKSPDEVKRYFVDKYGEWILLEPKAEGFNLLVYLLPVLGIAVGVLVIWRAVKKWTLPADAAGGAS
jgi:cytochrome c-type biogenesis protein CcmH